MKRIGIVPCLFLIGFFNNANAASAENGYRPNGKPFVELQGQIVEVNGAIADIKQEIENLIGHVQTLEERAAASENAIANIKSKNSIIIVQIEELITQLAASNNDVANALQDIEVLQQKINELTISQGNNASLIADLEYQVEVLENKIATTVPQVLSLQSQLETNNNLIAGLQQQIDEANRQIALRQAFLAGECPSGSALRAVNPDGSIECETTVSNGTHYLSRIKVTQYLEVDPRVCTGWETLYGMPYCIEYGPSVASVTASCPEGGLLESGGIEADSSYLSMIANTNITVAQGQVGGSYKVTVKNWSSSSYNIYIYANCLRVYEAMP